MSAGARSSSSATRTSRGRSPRRTCSDGATDERGVPLEVRSAGTHATEGQPASARTRSALDDAARRSRRARRAPRAPARDDDVDVGRPRRRDGGVPGPRSCRRTLPRGRDTGRRPSRCSPASCRTTAGRSPSASRRWPSRPSTPMTTDDVADPAGGDDAVYARDDRRRSSRSATRSRGASRAEHTPARRATYDPPVEVADSVIELIGNTPLVRLHKVADGAPAQVLAKVEYLNPGGLGEGPDRRAA